MLSFRKATRLFKFIYIFLLIYAQGTVCYQIATVINNHFQFGYFHINRCGREKIGENDRHLNQINSDILIISMFELCR